MSLGMFRLLRVSFGVSIGGLFRPTKERPEKAWPCAVYDMANNPVGSHLQKLAKIVRL